jgi:hypothetical protein
VSAWLLLIYKIPREPSAARVGIWRKIKQLGAILLHDSVWVLPANPRSQEQFQWLAAEIVELGGEATLCHSEIASEAQRKVLVKQFSDRADDAYKQILTELRHKRADLALLGRKYQQVQGLDYFQSKLGEKVRDALLSRGDKSLFIPRDAPLPENAEPFDIPGVRLSHHGGHCSFHTFVREYKLDDPILAKIARIVDEADTVQEVNVEPAAPGLDMICSGIRLTSPDDFAALEKGALVYEAVYAQLTGQ